MKIQPTSKTQQDVTKAKIQIVLSRYCHELGRLGLPGIGLIGPNRNQAEEA